MMKIHGSVRALFQQQLEANKRLRSKVDERLRAKTNERWHYESRLKKEESFALKLETGRCADPAAMEDFFALTIVVRNSTEIADVEQLILGEFDLVERRPLLDNKTRSRPSEFVFDDLRLYVRWRDDPSLQPSGVTGIVFEVQIKTFLKHAWSIATHDLIYKTPEPHWGKQRTAFQVRAMLENAEVSIEQADALATSARVAKTSDEITNLTSFIEVLRDMWPVDELPQNLRLLAENVAGVCRAVKVDPAKLREILKVEFDAGRGALTRNLSPYSVVLDALFRHKANPLLEWLTESKTRVKPRNKVFITPEVDVPPTVDVRRLVNAILLPRDAAPPSIVRSSIAFDATPPLAVTSPVATPPPAPGWPAQPDVRAPHAAAGLGPPPPEVATPEPASGSVRPTLEVPTLEKSEAPPPDELAR